MAKSFIDLVQHSPRTRLGIPVKTKKSLSRTNTPPRCPSPPRTHDQGCKQHPTGLRIISSG